VLITLTLNTRLTTAKENRLGVGKSAEAQKIKSMAGNKIGPTEQQIALWRSRLLNRLREEAREIYRVIASFEPEDKMDLEELLARLDK
jgi:hypothetical protein